MFVMKIFQYYNKNVSEIYILQNVMKRDTGIALSQKYDWKIYVNENIMKCDIIV